MQECLPRQIIYVSYFFIFLCTPTYLPSYYFLKGTEKSRRERLADFSVPFKKRVEERVDSRWAYLQYYRYFRSKIYDAQYLELSRDSNICCFSFYSLQGLPIYLCIQSGYSRRFNVYEPFKKNVSRKPVLAFKIYFQ